MARPKQTTEEKLELYKTKYKNCELIIKQKDAELERLRKELAEWHDQAVQWHDIALALKDEAKKTQEIAKESQRIAESYKTMAEYDPNVKHRRKWLNRRPYSRKKD